MKKLSTLIIAFLLTAGMAYAQNNGGNDAVVSQTGNGNDATVDQQGSSNDAIITQVTAGLDVTSYIEQVGANNAASADITAGGAMTRGATSIQNQSGDDNAASIVSTSASQDMNAVQTQIGDRNEAIVVTYSDGIVAQTQIGNDNFAEANIVGKAMYTTQIQFGNDNRATMNAGNASAASTYQEQIGNDNFSAINGFSSRGSARSDVNTYQEGDLNNVTVNFGPSGNFADVDQIGNMNNALIGFGSEFNSATIMQNGNSNMATVSQN